MKRLSTRLLLLASFAGLVSAPAFADTTQFLNKSILQIEMSPSDNCVFFQLDGVSEVNGTGSGPWFAVSLVDANGNSDPRGNALYALLLTARTTGTALNRVLANGSQACSKPQAFIVDF